MGYLRQEEVQLMNTFDFLLLGHLIADWLLQSDWMARGKRRGLLALAGFVHYALYTTIILLILAWSKQEQQQSVPTLVIGVIVFLTHWLIDGSNLVRWLMKVIRQRDQVMVRIMVDQTLHLLVLGSVALWHTSQEMMVKDVLIYLLG